MRTVASLGSRTAAIVLSRIRAITSGLLAMLPGVFSTSRATRSGWCAAVHATTQPPSDSPDRCGASMSSASSRPSRWADSTSIGVRAVGQVGPAVADHVVGGDAEVLGQPGDVPGVRLQVAAGPVQQDQVGPGPGAQHAGADPVDVDVAQLVVDVGQLAPDADVLGQARSSLSVPNRARASRDGGQAGALPPADAEQAEQPGVLDGEELDRVLGRVVVVAVPGPGRRVDEVAGGPGAGLVLHLAVAVAGDARSAPSRGGGAACPCSARAGSICRKSSNVVVGSLPAMASVVGLCTCPAGSVLQLGRVHDDRARGARADGVGRSRRGTRPC